MKKEVPVFYAPPECVAGGARITLPPDEATHAVRVLRRQRGDRVEVVDGRGNWYRILLDQASKDQVAGAIVEHRSGHNEPAAHLRIGVALLKHRQRFDTFLEKGTELGVTEILPLVTRRTQARAFRADRAHRVMVAAMKQCRRSALPLLHAPERLEAVLGYPWDGVKCVAHQRARSPLNEILDARPAEGVTVLIGPEAGFAEDEVLSANSRGFLSVALGPRRLRAETAAIVAAATVTMHRSRARRQA